MGKYEKYKTTTDSRDVFDKIGDWVAPAVGTAGGYLLARKFGRKAFPYNKTLSQEMAVREGYNPELLQKESGSTMSNLEADYVLEKAARIKAKRGIDASLKYLKGEGMEAVRRVDRTANARRITSGAGAYAGYETGSGLQEARHKK